MSASAATATLAAVLLGGALAGCSGGSSKSPSPAAQTRPAPSRPLSAVGGDVVVRREGRSGIVIRDRATRGKRFFLSGIQAGECLSYVKANPEASARDVRAACPGEAVVAIGKKP